MEGQPNVLVTLTLAAFLPATLAAFSRLGPRRGMLASMLAGWLFLPHFDRVVDVPLLHTKAMFVPAVVLVASLAFDLRRWRRFRPKWVDLPVAAMVLAPVAAALSNDLGAYEAGSAALEAVLVWGTPYLLARFYLGEPRALEEFAMAHVLAALAYTPFCLWEIRMSPHLHETLYGFSTSGMFVMSIRFGGFRPIVFLSTGLAVGMFMTTGTLAALWMWRTGARRMLAGVPFGWVAGYLVVVTLLCKSTGSIVLLAAGYAALEATRRMRTPALVLVLVAVPVAYCAFRLSGWAGDRLVSLAQHAISEERAQSLQFRLTNEDMLMAKALKRPTFGWGRFGRSRIYDEDERDVTVVDGMWIVQLGVTGFVGLIALGALLAAPALLLLRRYPARIWADPRLAPAASLAVAAVLWSIDDLFNAMMSPLFPAIAGAVLSFVLAKRSRSRRPVPIPARAAAAAGAQETWVRGSG